MRAFAALAAQIPESKATTLWFSKGRAKFAEETKRVPKFLNVADAARWQLHPETVRDMARQ
ncbi:MAG: hypothetical protein ACLQVW_06455 [Limisphaerales bacterium]